MKKLKDADIKGKTVLLRVDFNVTIKDGKVTEDFRMRAVLPSMRHLLGAGAKKVVIISHFGRPKIENYESGIRNQEIDRYTLKPVAEHLSQLLAIPVGFIADPPGEGLRAKIEGSARRGGALEKLRI